MHNLSQSTSFNLLPPFLCQTSASLPDAQAPLQTNKLRISREGELSLERWFSRASRMEVRCLDTPWDSFLHRSITEDVPQGLDNPTAGEPGVQDASVLLDLCKRVDDTALHWDFKHRKRTRFGRKDGVFSGHFGPGGGWGNTYSRPRISLFYPTCKLTQITH